MAESEDLRELVRQAYFQHNAALDEARLKRDEGIRLAKQSEKQAFIDARQKIDDGNERLLETKESIERAIRKSELLELVRGQERYVAEAAEASRQAIRQAKEDEETAKAQAKIDYEQALADIETKKLDLKNRPAIDKKAAAAEKRKMNEEIQRLKREEEAKHAAEVKQAEEAGRRAAEEAKRLKREEDKKLAAGQRQSEKEGRKAVKVEERPRDERPKEEPRNKDDERVRAEARKQSAEADRLAREADARQKEAAARQQIIDKKFASRASGSEPSPAPGPATWLAQPVEPGPSGKQASPPVSIFPLKGVVKLVMSAASESAAVRELENGIVAWPDTKLLLSGGEDSDITIIISVKEQVDLVGRLSALPCVQDARTEGELVRLTLRGAGQG